jgi:hypothetical protein
VSRAGLLFGAAALPPETFDAIASPFFQQPSLDGLVSRELPALNERARGWLRFLWDKATTPDDWSSRGKPHPWWDVYSAPGVQSFGRFDLQYSSYALLLMADQTPAWREVYTRIADGLAGRFPTYWGAIDWLTQIGNDPKRKNYSGPELGLLPPDRPGSYDRVGWTANGVKPWGLQPDPIAADGFLFFRGWFNLVLAVYKYVSGDDKWERPFAVTGYRDRQFQWDHHRIADHLAQQYTTHPAGPHCENTKIWFLCNSAAALGLYLYDKVNGTQKYRQVENWLEYARTHYISVSSNGKLESVTRFYDPLINYKANVGAAGGLDVALHLLPQQRELAAFLYEAATDALGWRGPNASSPFSIPLILAREFGDEDVARRFKAAAEQANEPRFFGDHNEKFGWFFQLNEPYPRGQSSAMMMVAEVGEPGSWTRAFSAPHLNKFEAPTVEGIDYPSVGIAQAWNDPASGVLHVVTYPAAPDRRGLPTTWRVSKLPNPTGVTILRNGELFDRWEVIAKDGIRLDTTVDSASYQIKTNYRSSDRVAPTERPERELSGPVLATNRTITVEPAGLRQAAAELASGRGPTCPCCAG